MQILTYSNAKTTWKRIYILMQDILKIYNKEGYFNAGNEYLAEEYGVHKNTISAWVSKLVKAKLIKVEIKKHSVTGFIIGRYITPLFKLVTTKEAEPVTEPVIDEIEVKTIKPKKSKFRPQPKRANRQELVPNWLNQPQTSKHESEYSNEDLKAIERMKQRQAALFSNLKKS